MQRFLTIFSRNWLVKKLHDCLPLKDGRSITQMLYSLAQSKSKRKDND